MKILLTVFFLAFGGFHNNSVDQNQVYECELSFEILNAGFVTSGTLDGQILENTFNPAMLDKSSVIVVAAPSTIKTGIAIRDKHLQREEFFDTSKYPQIKVTSRSFKKISRNRFAGTFALVIKDKIKDIEVPFVVDSKDLNTCHGSLSISRRAFNIGDESLILADEVIIKFEIHKAAR